MRGKDQKLWIDLETSGLDRKKHGVVQIAGAIEINYKLINTFNYTMRLFPGDRISKKSIETHGFTIDDIKKFIPPHNQFIQIVKMLREYVDPGDKRDKFTMFAYNADFDYGFLRTWWEKNNSPFFGSYVWYPPVDVMTKAAEVLQPERHLLKNMKLKTVAKYLGINVDESKLHDAFYDIELTRDVYHRLLYHDGTPPF